VAVARGLIILSFVIFMLFFGLFSVAPSRNRLDSAIFRSFFPLPLPLPGNFSADALACELGTCDYPDL